MRTNIKKTQRSRSRTRVVAGVRSEPKPPFARQHLKAPGLESALTPRPRYRALQYKAAGKLKGKVAFITGGDSGIGRAVAVLFAREGANVAISYHSPRNGRGNERILGRTFNDNEEPGNRRTVA